jgi:hypothetical protein
MKNCPICNRTYADETLTFCLSDGSLLSAPYDPDATQRIPRYQENIPTEVVAPSAPISKLRSNTEPLLNDVNETHYYVDNDVTVTSLQIVSKSVTLMIGDIASVEYRSDNSVRKGAVVLLLISGFFLRYVIYESDKTLVFRTIVGCLSLLLCGVSLYGLIVGFGSIYVNSHGQQIKVVEGFGPVMRRVKQAIGKALLKKKARNT